MDWFRMYSEARNDAKLRSLTDGQFRTWFNLLCFAAEQQRNRGSITGYDLELLAVEVAGGDVGLLTETMERLQRLRIITVNDEGTVAFINFDKRNYNKPSDTPEETRERKRRQRERERMSRVVTPCHATDTDTDTDTDIDIDPDKQIQIKDQALCYTNNQSDREGENAASGDHPRAFPDIVELDNMPPITPETWQKLEDIKTQPKDKQLSALVIEYSQRYPDQAKQWGTRGRIAARKHFDEVVSQGIEPHDILVEILFHQPDGPDEPEPKPWEITAGLLECRGMEQTPAQVLYSMLKFDREVGISGAPRDPPTN